MKNKKFMGIFITLIILACFWNLFAQTTDRPIPQRDGHERLGPPPPPPLVSMVISPDAKYLYVFYGERIYQYELPNLKFLRSIGISSSKY